MHKMQCKTTWNLLGNLTLSSAQYHYSIAVLISVCPSLILIFVIIALHCGLSSVGTERMLDWNYFPIHFPTWPGTYWLLHYRDPPQPTHWYYLQTFTDKFWLQYLTYSYCLFSTTLMLLFITDTDILEILTNFTSWTSLIKKLEDWTTWQFLPFRRGRAVSSTSPPVL